MEIETSMDGITKWTGRVPPLDLSSVSVCPRETEHRWTTTMQKHSTSTNKSSCVSQDNKIIRRGSDDLPIDPREWSRADVWTWLVNMAKSEGLEANPELVQKFPMNGKALCLMTLDMYLSRVPVGGKMLYRDFRFRLARALSL